MIISEKIKQKMDKMREHFPTTQALLIPLLQEIQFEQGYLSASALLESASFLQLPLSKVKEVVSFYTMFQTEPIGKVHLQLCTNISCWLNGSEHLLECLEKKLKIQCGETTLDGKYTLSEVECLASCGTAPVLQVNEDYHEGLDEKKLMDLLEKIEGQIKNNDSFVGRTYRKELEL